MTAKKAKKKGKAADGASDAAVEALPPFNSGEIDEFLTHLAKERDVSAHTVTAYRRDLRELVRFLASFYGHGDWTWGGVDRLALRGFMAHLVRKGLSQRSIARALSASRSF